MPYYTGIFDSEVTDYYSWIIQKNDEMILGTAVPVSMKRQGTIASIEFDCPCPAGIISAVNQKIFTRP